MSKVSAYVGVQLLTSFEGVVGIASNYGTALSGAPHVTYILNVYLKSRPVPLRVKGVIPCSTALAVLLSPLSVQG